MTEGEHKIEYEFGGKIHFFKVTSKRSKEEYNISIKVNCDCNFMGVQGIPNGEICSHIKDTFKRIVQAGQININEG